MHSLSLNYLQNIFLEESEKCFQQSVYQTLDLNLQGVKLIFKLQASWTLQIQDLYKEHILVEPRTLLMTEQGVQSTVHIENLL